LTREADDSASTRRIPGEQIQLLWETVSSLWQAVHDWPDSAAWDDYGARLRGLCAGLLDRAPDGQDNSIEIPWIERLDEAFDELAALSELGEDVAFSDFAKGVQRLVDELRVPVGSAPGSHSGVQVLDAMAARGIPFRVLYILGLNEKVFPRHIHEDAFLRDGARRFLEADLGFKIQEKLAGYDEEQLLFHLLCGSAREHLALVCERADDSGRLLVPSAYLEPLQDTAAASVVTVPRRLSAKLAGLSQFDRARLTPADVTIAFFLDRRLPGRWLEQCVPTGHWLSRSVSAARDQERMHGPLGPHDGMAGELALRWDRLKTTGVSPSSLQEYATCPFRYFARHVLRLDPLPVPEVEAAVGPLELGMLAHEILRRCYRTLREAGDLSRTSLEQGHGDLAIETLRRVAGETFARFASANAVGRPLIWELSCQSLTRFLEDVVREDVAEMTSDGWEPVLFEVDLAGTLPQCGSAAEALPVRGRLDRVDWSERRRAFRIIDYKYKSGASPDSLDKNLPLAAVRGQRLQPPLYVSMAESALPPLLPGGPPDATCDSLWFYYLAPEWEQSLTRARFPGNAWSTSLRGPLLAAIGQTLEGIRAGRFFIFPEAKRICGSCDFRLICRRTSQAAVWRSRRDMSFIKPYRDLRRTVLPRNPEE
jgi:ATP-dependent helicase/nuclease subunit B